MAALAEILKDTGSFKNRKRVGRGIASGTGKTCGRGHKGQKSRSGVSIKGFEGGQMPIHRRLPKRGFNNIFADKPAIINLATIQDFIERKKLDEKKEITVEALVAAGCVRKNVTNVKLLGNGEIKAKVKISLAYVSKTAIEKVKKAGGEVKEA